MQANTLPTRKSPMQPNDWPVTERNWLDRVVELRPLLKFGDQKEIAKALGISLRQVQHAINGQYTTNFYAWRIARAMEERIKYNKEVSLANERFIDMVRKATALPTGEANTVSDSTSND